MMDITIAGVGAIGSHLALQLCLQGIVDHIHIYDYDVVSEDDIRIFSYYNKQHVNVPKVIAVKNIIDLYCDVDISIFNQKFPEDVSVHGLMVDCRDTKTNKFDFDIRISFDNGILNLDSRSNSDVPDDFYVDTEYMSAKNTNLIITAAAVCCEYIKKRTFAKRQIEFFDLANRDTIFKRR